MKFPLSLSGAANKHLHNGHLIIYSMILLLLWHNNYVNHIEQRFHGKYHKPPLLEFDLSAFYPKITKLQPKPGG